MYRQEKWKGEWEGMREGDEARRHENKMLFYFK